MVSDFLLVVDKFDTVENDIIPVVNDFVLVVNHFCVMGNDFFLYFSCVKKSRCVLMFQCFAKKKGGIAVIYKIAKHYRVSLDYLLLDKG